MFDLKNAEKYKSRDERRLKTAAVFVAAVTIGLYIAFILLMLITKLGILSAFIKTKPTVNSVGIESNKVYDCLDFDFYYKRLNCLTEQNYEKLYYVYDSDLDRLNWEEIVFNKEKSKKFVKYISYEGNNLQKIMKSDGFKDYLNELFVDENKANNEYIAYKDVIMNYIENEVASKYSNIIKNMGDNERITLNEMVKKYVDYKITPQIDWQFISYYEFINYCQYQLVEEMNYNEYNVMIKFASENLKNALQTSLHMASFDKEETILFESTIEKYVKKTFPYSWRSTSCDIFIEYLNSQLNSEELDHEERELFKRLLKNANEENEENNSNNSDEVNTENTTEGYLDNTTENDTENSDNNELLTDNRSRNYEGFITYLNSNLSTPNIEDNKEVIISSIGIIVKNDFEKLLAIKDMKASEQTVFSEMFVRYFKDIMKPNISNWTGISLRSFVIDYLFPKLSTENIGNSESKVIIKIVKRFAEDDIAQKLGWINVESNSEGLNDGDSVRYRSSYKSDNMPSGIIPFGIFGLFILLSAAIKIIIIAKSNRNGKLEFQYGTLGVQICCILEIICLIAVTYVFFWLYLWDIPIFYNVTEPSLIYYLLFMLPVIALNCLFASLYTRAADLEK